MHSQNMKIEKRNGVCVEEYLMVIVPAVLDHIVGIMSANPFAFNFAVSSVSASIQKCHDG